MGKIEHYKKTLKRENQNRLLKLLREQGPLRPKDLEARLGLSQVTISECLKTLESENKLDYAFKPDDRREKWYRIKPESREEVEVQLLKYEAIRFIEGIENPVYVYKESENGKKAIAAFASIPGLRRLAQKLIQTQISGFLPLLKTSPSSQKLAVIIMVGK